MKPRIRFSSRRNILATASTSMVLCLAGAAMAQTNNNWTGTTSSDWNTASNWSAGMIPTKTGNLHAVIDTSTPNIATITLGIIAPVDLIIANGAGTTGRLDHPSGDGSTGSGNWMYVGKLGTGIYNLANTAVPGTGVSTYGQGSGSMTTNGGRFYVGGYTAAGTGTFNMNTTGTLTVGSEMNISAGGGTGVMNFESGTVITNDWTRIGGGAGSKGTLNMTGGTLTKQGNNNMVIGGTGSTGVANISGGTINVNNEFWIGNAAGSKGTLNLSGGTITSNSWVSIGRDTATKGTLNFTGGTWTKTGGGNFIVGDNSPGEMNFSGESTSLNVNGEFWIGQSGGATGTMTFASGSITNSSWVAIGRGGNATLNMTGGTWTKNGTGSNFIIGSQGSGKTGTMNMSGGTVVVQPSTTADRGITWVGEQNGNTGNLNLSGTADFSTARLTLGANTGATGNSNLNGGTLRIGQLTGGAGNANVTFNGTQIVASAASGAFIDNLDTASISAGGLKIDSSGFNLSAAQVLTGSGGLVKSGSGTLNLTAANTYAGTTSVNGGKLGITTSSLANAAITLADYTSLGVTQTTADQAHSASAVTFGVADSTTLDIDLGAFAGNSANAPLNVTGTGALTLNGVVTVNVTDNLPVVGTIPLVSYAGAKSGTGSFALGTIPDGVVATFSDNGTGLVSLNVTRVNDAYWTGAVDTNWNTTSANWKDDYAETASTYQDGDPVMFDDRVTAAGPAISVSLDTTVAPGGSGVTFANATKNYTLSGTGKITGTTGLLKQGAGTVTLSTLNDYTGVTKVNGGTLSVATLADGGVASPIGAADNGDANIVLASGTLYYTGPATTIDRGFSTIGAGGGIATDNTLTVTGTVFSNGGTFYKSGNGNLVLGVDGLNVFGGGVMAGVNVISGTLTFDGTGLSQFNTVSGDIWVATTSASGANLVLQDTSVSGSGNYLAIARGSGTTGLTSTCTLTNSTLTTGNLSLGYANGVAGYLATSVLTLNDSTYTMTGINRLGESGGATGTVNLNGASHMTSGDTNIAQDGGSKGTLNVNDTSVYTSNNRLQVGPAAGSIGNVVIRNSGSMTVHAYVSVGFNGGGSMTVMDNGSFSNNDDFSVNESGDVPASVTLQDSGTMSIGGQVFVGRNTGRVGTVTQTGGTFTAATANEFQIGKYGTGSWLQSGGVTNAGGWVSIGRETGGTGVLTVSGTGAFNQTGADRAMIVGENGTGTLTVQPGATVTSVGSNGVIVSNNAAGVGTVNLDGGTLAVVKLTDGGGNSTFNFNGGTLVAGAGANAAFMGGLDAAYVKSGGATIDSNGQNIAISQALLDGTGGGGLAKTGAGTLQLNGANTYTGATTVNGGTLGGTGSITGPLVVGASGTIAPGASAGTFTTGAATISGTYACEIDGANCDKLAVNGALDVSTATLAITELSAPAASPLIIASYTGSTPAPFAAVTGMPAGYALDYSYGGNQIALVQTATPFQSWINGFTSIPAGDRDPGDDPDGDGVTNIAEFALNGNPASGSATGKVVGKVSTVDGSPALVLTLPVRSAASFSGTTEQVSALIDGVIYHIQGSDALSTWDLAVSEVTGADKTAIETGLPALDSGWTYRTFRSPGSVTGDPAEFLRAVIENP